MPPLGLWRLQSGGYSSPTKDGGVSTALPPRPTDPAEVFGDYVLFAITHTLALLQAALELQHNDSLLDLVQLVDAASVASADGRRLAEHAEYLYEWGGSTYAFLPSRLVPIVTGMHNASARLDGVLIDAPAPTLLPPLTPSADLQAFWKRARSQIKCGELVRRRLHALLMQGATYDHFNADPWEQYRVSAPAVSQGSSPAAAPPPKAWPPLGGAADAELEAAPRLASLQFEWMPEPLEGRDCSQTLLTRLRSTALLKLRDRERALQGAAPPGPAGADAAEPMRAQRKSVGVRASLHGGRATADVLQDLYLKARIREADEVKRQEEAVKERELLRARLELLSPRRVADAIGTGWDGLQGLFQTELGDDMWAQAVDAVPDDWEEEQALEALADLLRRPTESEHFWLLRPVAD